ncbi:hypothetical protein GCM10027037_23960 [Mucilaginibacter koreensis]
MPAFNAALYISEAIESVLQQTYQHWELLIVDDGSADDTQAVASKYLSDDRVSYFYQPNKKQGAARNLAIANSRGNYLAFLDADDIWLPEKLQLQMDILLSHPEIDLLFCQGYMLEDNKLSPMDVVEKNNWTIKNFPDFIAQNQIPILSVLAKKSAIVAAGAFDERIAIQNAEDYHLWLKMLINSAVFKSTTDRVFKYRVHSRQSTYLSNNLSLAVYSAIEDIFYRTSDIDLQKAIIVKIKMQLFNKELHQKSLLMIMSFLRLRRKRFYAFLLKYILFKPVPLQQRIAFKIISAFI